MVVTPGSVEFRLRSVIQPRGFQIRRKLIFGSDLWQFQRKEHLDLSVTCDVRTMHWSVRTRFCVQSVQSLYSHTVYVAAVGRIAVKR